jgi:hypothetical protein
MLDRGFRVELVAALLAQAEERVLERLAQVGLADDALVRQHEHPLQKARHQGRRIGLQQAPGRVLAAQGFQGVEVERHGHCRARPALRRPRRRWPDRDPQCSKDGQETLR